jgi:hypothetical protein
VQRLREENEKILLTKLSQWASTHRKDPESPEAIEALKAMVESRSLNLAAQRISLSAESFPQLFRRQFPRSRE